MVVYAVIIRFAGLVELAFLCCSWVLFFCIIPRCRSTNWYLRNIIFHRYLFGIYRKQQSIETLTNNKKGTKHPHNDCKNRTPGDQWAVVGKLDGRFVMPWARLRSLIMCDDAWPGLNFGVII